MVQPEKVLINMEVNYFQDDSDFSPLHNYSKEMQGSCGLLYAEFVVCAGYCKGAGDIESE